MAVGDLYSAVITYHDQGRFFQNTPVYQETEEETGGDPCQALADKLASAGGWFEMRDSIVDTAFLGSVIVYKFQGDKQPSGVTYFQDINGVLVGDSAPGNIGLRVQLNGQHQGRSSRGAFIFGALPETSIENGEWSSTQITKANSLMDNLLTPVELTAPNSGKYQLGFMSRAPVVAGDPLLAWPGTFVTPTSYNASMFPVSIKSRQTDFQASRLSAP